MNINALPSDNIETIHQVAKLLVEGFNTNWRCLARHGFSSQGSPGVFRGR